MTMADLSLMIFFAQKIFKIAAALRAFLHYQLIQTFSGIIFFAFLQGSFFQK